MSSLLKMAEQFSEQPQTNPPDVKARVNEFVSMVQARGEDLGKWTENEWILSLRQLGLNDDQIADELENVAGWGVVDNSAYG